MKSTLLILALASSALASDSGWRRLDGDRSRVTTPRAVVVGDEQAWAALWAEHAEADAPAPAVDFTKERVVAVFLGRRPSAGASVALDAAADPADPRAVIVTYSERRDPTAFGATVISTPFAIQKVPAERVVLKAAGAALPSAAAAKPAAAAHARFGASEDAQAAFASAESLLALRDAPNAARAFDGNVRLTQGLPPPPGQGGQEPQHHGGKPLPPPPGQGNQDPGRQGGGGKPLPPPPGSATDDEGKPLPPPPGQGKPLPPPPGTDLPRPSYPGGPLPHGDRRLDDAERTYSSYGLEYIGFWYNGSHYEAQRGEVKVGPADAGKSFILRLTSSKMQDYALFYRDPKDGRFVWMPDSDRTAQGVTRRLDVSFGPRTLLPWESERFTFLLDGRSLSLESQDGAYQYTLTTTTDPRDPESVSVTLNPGAKRLLAPDYNGVSASLVNKGGRLTLVVDDKWANEYAGETLELSVEVRQDSGKWYRRDPVIFTASGNGPLKVAGPHGEFDIAAGSGSGTYYLDSWSFRRAASRLSSGGWVNKGKSNTVKK